MRMKDTYHIRRKVGLLARCGNTKPRDMTYALRWYTYFEEPVTGEWEWCPRCVTMINPIELLAEAEL